MNEKNPRKSKPPYHVSIRQAVRLGYQAEGFSSDSKPNRRARMARMITARAMLRPTLNEFQQANSAHEARKIAKFNMMKEAALGPNKKILEILERAASLPDNLPAGTTREALASSHSTAMDKKHPNRPYNATPGEIHYGGFFVVNGASLPKGGEGRTATYLYTGDSDPLSISITTDSGNSLRVPINTLAVSYDAPATIEGERFSSYVSGVQAGSARITINQRHYNPERSRMYVNDGHDSRINEDNSFDGQVDFTLSPDGQLQQFSMGRNNSDSMVPVGGGAVDVDGFLRDFDHAVFETSMISRVPDDPARLQ